MIAEDEDGCHRGTGARAPFGSPSNAAEDILEKMPAPDLEDTIVAAFDDRLLASRVRLASFTAPRIARRLKKRGETLVGAAKGSIVAGGKGRQKSVRLSVLPPGRRKSPG